MPHPPPLAPRLSRPSRPSPLAPRTSHLAPALRTPPTSPPHPHPHPLTPTPTLSQVLTLLLNGLSCFKKRVKTASVMSGDAAPPPPRAPSLQRRPSSSSSEHTSQLEAVRIMLQANKSKVRDGQTRALTPALPLPQPPPPPQPQLQPQPQPQPQPYPQP
jgi:hypothetical protein